jgi:hypothetical protein
MPTMASREAPRPISAAPATPARPNAPARPGNGREEASPAADVLESHWAEAINSATD